MAAHYAFGLGWLIVGTAVAVLVGFMARRTAYRLADDNEQAKALARAPRRSRVALMAMLLLIVGEAYAFLFAAPDRETEATAMGPYRDIVCFQNEDATFYGWTPAHEIERGTIEKWREDETLRCRAFLNGDVVVFNARQVWLPRVTVHGKKSKL